METTNTTNPHINNINTKRISYILITKDRAEQVKKTLVLLQNLIGPDDELIIIDGASKDNTKEIIHAAGDLVDIFISEKDAGTSDAFNKGIMLAHGKYIRLLSDDDVTHRSAMDQVVTVMDAHLEIDLLVCGGTKQFLAKNTSYPFYVPPGTNYGTKIEHFFIYGACGAGFVLRTSSLPTIGLLPLDWFYANDIAFAAQCMSRGGVVRFCRINLFDHLVWDQSLSYTKRKESYEEKDRLIAKYGSHSFLLKRKLKKMKLVRALKIFWLSAVISHFIVLVCKRGFRQACLQATRRARGKNSTQIRAPIYQWDGGLS